MKLALSYLFFLRSFDLKRIGLAVVRTAGKVYGQCPRADHGVYSAAQLSFQANLPLGYSNFSFLYKCNVHLCNVHVWTSREGCVIPKISRYFPYVTSIRSESVLNLDVLRRFFNASKGIAGRFQVFRICADPF